MPAQYALAYYLCSTILGSLLVSLSAFLYINIPNGTLYFDGLGMVLLVSFAAAMIGSLPFHAWLNWLWHRRVSSEQYQHFFKSFLRKYWLGSTFYIVFIYTAYLVYFIFQFQVNGGNSNDFLNSRGLLNYRVVLPFIFIWLSYAPLGWWIIRRLKGAMDPNAVDV